jgi:hypothetical protein
MPQSLGGIILLVVGGFIVLGSCGGGSDTPTPEYSTNSTVTDNDDGSSTYHSTDNLGGDFTCTFSDDGSSSDCSGTP